MKFDFKKTLELIRGGLLSRETTWTEYLSENPGWQQTAMVLTGPLILLNVVLGVLFARMMGGYTAYGVHMNVFSALIFALVMAVIGFLVAVFVFNFLAGVFKGKTDFSRAFAAVSLAAIPAWVAGIVGALIPGIGFLISLAGAIMTLVFLYKIMPLALDVPSEKRVMHFVVSLIVIFLINLVVGMVIGADAMRDQMREGALGDRDSAAPAGVFGEWERQGRLMEEAGRDQYDPPSDGKVSEGQVEAYASVLRKTRAAQEEYGKKMTAIASEMDAKEKSGDTPSVADLGKLYSGVGSALSAKNAEMEIVKTAGGNWAEHQWVKEQLRIAKLQQGEGSDAIEHNYELYQEYADELEASP
ncbi:Yip1 family protein [Elongatibacter sediminis]|uniref:Yip1 family protein n=1 Tax=Elongatibacter sediminis TaxID=3119006 RepID=A0AAW9R8S8_9GAMM